MKNEKKNHKSTESGEQVHNKRDDLDAAMIRWTRVVGIFTAVLAFVGIVQAWAFINSERAFVTLDTLQIDTAKFLPAVAKFKNVGKENAYISGANVTEWVGTVLPTNPAYTNFVMGAGSIIGPGGVNSLILKASADTSKFMTPQKIAAIQTQKLSLWVFGYIRFRDDYSIWGDRIVGFCSRYVPNAPTPEAVFDSCASSAYVYQK